MDSLLANRKRIFAAVAVGFIVIGAGVYIVFSLRGPSGPSPVEQALRLAGRPRQPAAVEPSPDGLPPFLGGTIRAVIADSSATATAVTLVIAAEIYDPAARKFIERELSVPVSAEDEIRFITIREEGVIVLPGSVDELSVGTRIGIVAINGRRAISAYPEEVSP